MEIDICLSFQEWCGIISDIIREFVRKKINFVKNKYRSVQIIAEKTADDLFEKILIDSAKNQIKIKKVSFKKGVIRKQF